MSQNKTLLVSQCEPLNSDYGICDAARVSFAKLAKNFSEEDNKKLLLFLKNNNHWSPFGHAREIFAMRMSTEDWAHFLTVANTMGFTWSRTKDMIFLCGSIWAFYENMWALPVPIANAIRRWYHNCERYKLTAPMLFRQPGFKIATDVQRVAPKDGRSFVDLTSVSLRMRAPIFVARQLVKHQQDLCWNEESRRYIDNPPTFFSPALWRARPEGKIKQGSADHAADLPATLLSAAIYHDVQPAQLYDALTKHDTAPELARMVLPQSMVVEWIWTGSIRAFHRVMKLRTDAHAQKETQQIGQQIDTLVGAYVPKAWESLTNEPNLIEKG